MLSPLTIITVMEVTSREISGELPWELLYADDLVLIAQNEDELRQKLLTWKSTLEAEGLKAIVSKTKVVFGGKCNKAAVWHVECLCGLCSKIVGRNSIWCTSCSKWIHKRGSGVKGCLGMVQYF